MVARERLTERRVSSALWQTARSPGWLRGFSFAVSRENARGSLSRVGGWGLYFGVRLQESSAAAQAAGQQGLATP